MLNGLLRCKACNSAMFAIYTKKKGCKYHYYLCAKAQKHGYHSCPTRLLNTVNTEHKVFELVRQVLNDENSLKNILDAINQGNDTPFTLSKLKQAFLINSPLWNELFPQEKARFLKTLLKQIDYDASKENLSLIFNEAGIKFLCSLNLDVKKGK
jgi:YesN/AraC family two-component response regulator